MSTKLQYCEKRYALTWCESPERACVAYAETPAHDVLNFATILLRLRVNQVRFLLLWNKV